MGAALELLTRILVLVNSTQDGNDLLLGRQRDRAGNLSAVALSGLDDLLCGLVDQLVILRLQANANLLCVCHCGISSSYVCHTLNNVLTRYGEKLQLRRAYHATGMKITGRTDSAAQQSGHDKKRKWFKPSA